MLILQFWNVQIADLKILQQLIDLDKILWKTIDCNFEMFTTNSFVDNFEMFTTKSFDRSSALWSKLQLTWLLKKRVFSKHKNWPMTMADGCWSEE
jgi:hypothetical protein